MKKSVIFDARFVPGFAGGTEQVALSLLRTMANQKNNFALIAMRYAGNHKELNEICLPENQWITVSAPSTLITQTRKLPPIIKSSIKKFLEFIPKSPGAITQPPPELQNSNASLIHFNTQRAFQTSIRNIYQPWDLLHCHHPEFFSQSELSERNANYSFFCRQATLVVVTSEWGKQDLIKNLGVAPEKIRVVPMASPISTATLSDSPKIDLPFSSFMLYPAQSYPHKNHIRLMQAIKKCKTRGIDINLICTGRKTDHWLKIASICDDLGITNHIHHFGYTSESTLDQLYSAARCMVFPSLFEGWGLPLTEAMTKGVPITASNATCIPEQIGNAGLLFDPLSIDSISSSIEEVWTSQPTRDRLSTAGKIQSAKYSWQKTSEIFTTIYSEFLD